MDGCLAEVFVLDFRRHELLHVVMIGLSAVCQIGMRSMRTVGMLGILSAGCTNTDVIVEIQTFA